MFVNLKSVICFWAFVLLLGALPYSAEAGVWKDSLYVRLGDPQVDRTGSDAVLTFDLEVYRPVDKWDKDDYALGASDFYLGRKDMDMSAIFKNLKVESLNPEITNGSVGALHLSGRMVLGNLHISLTPNVGVKSKLEIPYQKWLKLCKVRLTLVNPSIVEIGLVWNRTATGLITRGNIPILEVLKDDLEKIPDKVLTFTDYSSSQKICEGEEVLLYAKAASSGNALTYKWQEKFGTGWVDIPDTQAGQKGHTDEWAGAPTSTAYQYQLRGADRDTLVVRGITGAQSGLAFRCTAEDLSLGTTPTENYRETPDMVVTVFPKVQVALEGYANVSDYRKHLKQPNDIIEHCPGSSVKARVVFYGFTTGTELQNLGSMGGNLYVEYGWIDAVGSIGRDTLKVKVSDVGSQLANEVVSSDKMELNLSDDGKYYIRQVWTDSCSKGEVLSAYDTVIVRTRGSVAYTFDPITYVAGSGGYDVVKELEKDLGITFTTVELLGTPLGSVVNSQYECMKGKVGTDTLLYTYEQGECSMTAKRLIHVISSKSVAIRVFLEGPYNSKADSMSCIPEVYFPSTLSNYKSPYPDQVRIPKPFPAFDHKVVDWIYVEAWDYPPNGKNYTDSKRGHRMDSTSALLLSDGTIAGINGNKYVSFDHLTGDEYYIIIKHRNHLSVMSAKPIQFFSTGTPKTVNTIDFTAKMENAFDIEGAASQKPPMKSVAGRCVLYAGEVVDDRMITASDAKAIISGKGAYGYRKEDLNFDCFVASWDQQMGTNNHSVYVKY